MLSALNLQVCALYCSLASSLQTGWVHVCVHARRCAQPNLAKLLSMQHWLPGHQCCVAWGSASCLLLNDDSLMCKLTGRLFNCSLHSRWPGPLAGLEGARQRLPQAGGQDDCGHALQGHRHLGHALPAPAAPLLRHRRPESAQAAAGGTAHLPARLRQLCPVHDHIHDQECSASKTTNSCLHKPRLSARSR